MRIYQSVVIVVFSTTILLIAASCGSGKDLNQSNKNNNQSKRTNPNVKQSSTVNRYVDTSRTNTYRVTYNYATGLYEENNLKARIGEPMVFVVNNINKLAYNVEVKVGESVVSESYVDSEIKELIKNYNNPSQNAQLNDASNQGEQLNAVLTTEDVVMTSGSVNQEQKKKFVELINNGELVSNLN